MFRSGLEISPLMNAACCTTWMSLCNVFVCDVMLVVYYLYNSDVSNGSYVWRVCCRRYKITLENVDVFFPCVGSGDEAIPWSCSPQTLRTHMKENKICLGYH